MRNARDDLPSNPEMDSVHAAHQEALIKYLTTKAGRDERKEIVKEAITEWLDEKYQMLGKWTLNGLMAAAVALLGYLILWTNGWRK